MKWTVVSRTGVSRRTTRRPSDLGEEEEDREDRDRPGRTTVPLVAVRRQATRKTDATAAMTR